MFLKVYTKLFIVPQSFRYNLKRKVASLPHVTKADFDSRLAKHVSDQVKANQSNSQDYCVACCKSFSSEKSYKNHINSKKHAEASLRFESKENKVVMHKSFILFDVLMLL